MSTFQLVTVDGKTVLLPAEPVQPPANPPLTALNAADQARAQQERANQNDALEVARAALNSAFTPNGKRVQKPFRPAG